MCSRQLLLMRTEQIAWLSQVEARLNIGDAEDVGTAVSLAEDVYGPFSGQARSHLALSDDRCLMQCQWTFVAPLLLHEPAALHKSQQSQRVVLYQ